MQEPTHVIDPDGEIILVLKDANQPFAVWPEEEDEDDEDDARYVSLCAIYSLFSVECSLNAH